MNKISRIIHSNLTLWFSQNPSIRSAILVLYLISIGTYGNTGTIDGSGELTHSYRGTILGGYINADDENGRALHGTNRLSKGQYTARHYNDPVESNIKWVVISGSAKGLDMYHNYEKVLKVKFRYVEVWVYNERRTRIIEKIKHEQEVTFDIDGQEEFEDLHATMQVEYIPFHSGRSLIEETSSGEFKLNNRLEMHIYSPGPPELNSAIRGSDWMDFV